jgi:transcriptional regulator with XRE-family HTH domain
MTVPRSPAFAARMLGQELVKLRVQAGLTLAEVDGRMPDMSVSKLGRLERGEGGKPKIRDVEALLAEYGADEETARSIRSLTDEARVAQRWFNPGVLPRSFRPLIALEESASRHRAWECQHVPSLLQTEDYARAVLETNIDASPDDVDHRLRHRLHRQSVLDGEDPITLWAILDEDVLHRPVGSVEVMRDQLARLARAARKPHISVQVVPRDVGAHGGMGVGFMILDFPEEADMTAVYLDTVSGGIRSSQPREVQRFDELWAHLRTLALNQSKSVKLISEVAKSL